MTKTILISLPVEDLQSLIIDCVNSCLKHNSNSTEKTNEPDQLLTVDQAAEFLNLSKATIYTKVSRRELPFMKRSKRLYFSQKELMLYLTEGRHKTSTDISKEAEVYLHSSRETK